MNIAHELNLFRPKEAVIHTSPDVLKRVYSAISNGFNMTHNDVSRVTGLSVVHVGNTARKLYSLGYLSRIPVKNNRNVDQYAYTAIKPLKGE